MTCSKSACNELWWSMGKGMPKDVDVKVQVLFVPELWRWRLLICLFPWIITFDVYICCSTGKRWFAQDAWRLISGTFCTFIHSVHEIGCQLLEHTSFSCGRTQIDSSREIHQMLIFWFFFEKGQILWILNIKSDCIFWILKPQQKKKNVCSSKIQK